MSKHDIFTQALLTLDIDHFKNVNDTYGHGIGDEVLKEAVRLVKESIRDTDIFGRIGGEEFALLLPQTSKDGAVNTAERIRRKIAEEMSIPHANGPVRITVSIGVSSVTGGPANAENLMKEADMALYRAKDEGRNRVCSF